jgi:DNA modification methylase/ParB-like chromosome segregation protein Spo0J
MTYPEILISDVIVSDRQRIDHSDTDGLKASLAEFGTIQPIVLEKLSDGSFRLIAGGRRLHFLRELAHTRLYHGSVYVPDRPGYVFGEELTEEQLTLLEQEENLRRKQMTWQEDCLAIYKIHRLRAARGNPDGGRWTREATGRLMKLSLGSVSNLLWAASELQKPDSPLWKMDGITEALQWKLQKEQERYEAELARRHVENSRHVAEQFSLPNVLTDSPLPDPIEQQKLDARQQYLSNPLNDPDAFESYWEERQVRLREPAKIYLSNRLFRANALDFLRDRPGMFDHIITDPPYAIDMDNLEQVNVGMTNIDSVRHTHDVAKNLELLYSLFPLAYSSLKPNGFLILWCDQEVWQQLFDWATKAGFKVQRWPITWVKTHQCQNTAAAFNFTKTTEIAMVCRKGNAQMIQLNTPSHIIASHDDFKSSMDHPFVKPFAVWEHLLNAVSIKGQLICDPFCGEGSAILSMLRLERTYFGCELDPVHYNKLLENVKREYRALDPNTIFI